jgi:hypothetical protein
MVTATISRESPTVVEVCVDSIDSPILVTREHLFWSADRSEWVPAGDMVVAEVLATIDGVARVRSIRERHELTRVYNLEIGLYQTYFVSDAGLWVHNTYMDVAKAWITQHGKKFGLPSNFGFQLGDKIGGRLVQEGLEGARVIIYPSGEVYADRVFLGTVMDILFGR